ncbi:MAG: hypothetical protein Q9219_006482 [cf. Caloplaca sp. 3 TL-2023]
MSGHQGLSQGRHTSAGADSHNRPNDLQESLTRDPDDTKPEMTCEEASKRADSTGRVERDLETQNMLRGTGKNIQDEKQPATTKAKLEGDPKTWLCLCRKGVKHECSITKKCMCRRFADANPKHTLLITRNGERLFQEWFIDQMKRDADFMGAMAYNDFSGYGAAEVVDNMLSTFNGVIKHEPKDIWSVWAHIEGMARFLSQDNYKWYHIDDAEGNAKRVMLLGTATLTAVDLLIDQGLFSQNSQMRNLGLMLGLVLQFAVEFEETCSCNEDGWRKVLVRKLDQHKVQIDSTAIQAKDLAPIREDLAQEAVDEEEENEGEESKETAEEKKGREQAAAAMDTSKPDDQQSNHVLAYKPKPFNPTGFYTDGEVRRLWDVWNWDDELAAYTQYHGRDGKIGGSHYDLTVPGSEDSANGEEEEDEEEEEEI